MDTLRIADPSLRRELWYSVKPGGESAGIVKKFARRAEAKPTVAEQRLLELLFSDDQLRGLILFELDQAIYEDLPTAPIFQALKEVVSEGAAVDFTNLGEKTRDSAVASELLPMLMMTDSGSSEAGSENNRLTAKRCIDALRLMKIDREIQELSARILAAERVGDIENRDKLATEHLELARQRSSLLPRAEAMQTGP